MKLAALGLAPRQKHHWQLKEGFKPLLSLWGSSFPIPARFLCFCRQVSWIPKWLLRSDCRALIALCQGNSCIARVFFPKRWLPDKVLEAKKKNDAFLRKREQTGRKRESKLAILRALVCLLPKIRPIGQLLSFSIIVTFFNSQANQSCQASCVFLSTLRTRRRISLKTFS